MWKRRRKNPIWGVLRGILLPVFCVAVLLAFSTALDSLSSGRDEEDLRQLEDALRRGCAACYACEGVYPPNLDYLKEHYGVQVDEGRYDVHYDVFADNMLPDITVLVRTP